MANTQSEFRSSGVVIESKLVVPANTTLNQFDVLYANDAGDIALKEPGITTVAVYTVDGAGFLQVNTDFIMTTSTTVTSIRGCTLGRIPGE